MKKFLKFILSLTVILVANLTSVLTIACGTPKVDDYVTMYQKYHNENASNPYYDFIKDAMDKLNQSVCAEDNYKFNRLYDDGSALRTWADYNSLQNVLIRKPLNLNDPQTFNVNWNAMYNRVGLSISEKTIALNQQLRFYNILAAVYGVDNAVRLVQWIREAPAQQGNIVAYNEYYPGVNSQTQTYGPYFANKSVIHQQFRSGYWATDQLTTVSTHENGHALSNFLSASQTQRNRFNTTYIDINSFDDNMKINKKVSNVVFNDRTQNLINYLSEDAISRGLTTITNSVQKFLFAIYTITSGYSHSAWSDDNVNQRDEFFAEAFSYWLLTPESDRNVSWALVNDYFVDYVPKFYNIQITKNI